MNVMLKLSPDEVADLKERASASGTDVRDFVLGAVRARLIVDDSGSDRHPAGYQQWSREFREWLASHHSRNPDFDDRRESIYD